MRLILALKADLTLGKHPGKDFVASAGCSNAIVSAPELRMTAIHSNDHAQMEAAVLRAREARVGLQIRRIFGRNGQSPLEDGAE